MAKDTFYSLFLIIDSDSQSVICYDVTNLESVYDWSPIYSSNLSLNNIYCGVKSNFTVIDWLGLSGLKTYKLININRFNKYNWN